MGDELGLFQEQGFVVLEGVVNPHELAGLSHELASAFDRARAAGTLFSGGGTVSGHLNCFPGAGSRFVYQALEARGVFELVAQLSPTPLRKPNIGCNFNLPNSSPQNPHVDGYFETPFLVANVAAVDTTLENGAMEILPGTHRRRYKYWEIAYGRLPRRRVPLRQGDVVVRISTLWHRGMPNRTAVPRPMLAFTWEDGGSSVSDPYDRFGGAVTFLPNRYHTSWKGRLLESAFVSAPRLGTALRAARSLLE